MAPYFRHYTGGKKGTIKGTVYGAKNEAFHFGSHLIARKEAVQINDAASRWERHHGESQLQKIVTGPIVSATRHFPGQVPVTFHKCSMLFASLPAPGAQGLSERESLGYPVVAGKHVHKN